MKNLWRITTTTTEKKEKSFFWGKSNEKFSRNGRKVSESLSVHKFTVIYDRQNYARESINWKKLQIQFLWVCLLLDLCDDSHSNCDNLDILFFSWLLFLMCLDLVFRWITGKTGYRHKEIRMGNERCNFLFAEKFWVLSILLCRIDGQIVEMREKLENKMIRENFPFRKNR